jgi:hypothetical protein
MSVRAAIPAWQMNIRCDIELDLVSGTGYLTAAAAADSTGLPSNKLLQGTNVGFAGERGRRVGLPILKGDSRMGIEYLGGHCYLVPGSQTRMMRLLILAANRVVLRKACQ